MQELDFQKEYQVATLSGELLYCAAAYALGMSVRAQLTEEVFNNQVSRHFKALIFDATKQMYVELDRSAIEQQVLQAVVPDIRYTLQTMPPFEPDSEWSVVIKKDNVVLRVYAATSLEAKLKGFIISKLGFTVRWVNNNSGIDLA